MPDSIFLPDVPDGDLPGLEEVRSSPEFQELTVPEQRQFHEGIISRFWKISDEEGVWDQAETASEMGAFFEQQRNDLENQIANRRAEALLPELVALRENVAKGSVIDPASFTKPFEIHQRFLEMADSFQGPDEMYRVLGALDKIIPNEGLVERSLPSEASSHFIRMMAQLSDTIVSDRRRRREEADFVLSTPEGQLFWKDPERVRQGRNLEGAEPWRILGEVDTKGIYAPLGPVRAQDHYAYGKDEALIREAAGRERMRIDFLDEVRDLLTQRVDPANQKLNQLPPIEGDMAVLGVPAGGPPPANLKHEPITVDTGRAVQMLSGTLGYMTALSAGPPGFVAVANQAADDEYKRLSQMELERGVRFSPARKQDIAATSGLVYASIEQAQRALALGRGPLRGVFDRIQAQGFSRFVGNLGLNLPIEVGEEFAQEATPYLIEELVRALDEEFREKHPGVDWKKEFEPFLKDTPEMVLSFLPLILWGAGVDLRSFSSAKAVADKLNHVDVGMWYGMSSRDAARIAAIADPVARMREVRKLQEAGALDPGSDTALEAGKRIRKTKDEALQKDAGIGELEATTLDLMIGEEALREFVNERMALPHIPDAEYRAASMEPAAEALKGKEATVDLDAIEGLSAADRAAFEAELEGHAVKVEEVRTPGPGEPAGITVLLVRDDGELVTALPAEAVQVEGSAVASSKAVREAALETIAPQIKAGEEPVIPARGVTVEELQAQMLPGDTVQAETSTGEFFNLRKEERFAVPQGEEAPRIVGVRLIAGQQGEQALSRIRRAGADFDTFRQTVQDLIASTDQRGGVLRQRRLEKGRQFREQYLKDRLKGKRASVPITRKRYNRDTGQQEAIQVDLAAVNPGDIVEVTFKDGKKQQIRGDAEFAALDPAQIQNVELKHDAVRHREIEAALNQSIQTLLNYYREEGRTEAQAMAEGKQQAGAHGFTPSEDRVKELLIHGSNKRTFTSTGQLLSAMEFHLSGQLLTTPLVFVEEVIEDTRKLDKEEGILPFDEDAVIALAEKAIGHQLVGPDGKALSTEEKISQLAKMIMANEAFQNEGVLKGEKQWDKFKAWVRKVWRHIEKLFKGSAELAAAIQAEQQAGGGQLVDFRDWVFDSLGLKVPEEYLARVKRRKYRYQDYASGKEGFALTAAQQNALDELGITEVDWNQSQLSPDEEQLLGDILQPKRGFRFDDRTRDRYLARFRTLKSLRAAVVRRARSSPGPGRSALAREASVDIVVERRDIDSAARWSNRTWQVEVNPRELNRLSRHNAEWATQRLDAILSEELLHGGKSMASTGRQFLDAAKAANREHRTEMNSARTAYGGALGGWAVNERQAFAELLRQVSQAHLFGTITEEFHWAPDLFGRAAKFKERLPEIRESMLRGEWGEATARMVRTAEGMFAVADVMEAGPTESSGLDEAESDGFSLTSRREFLQTLGGISGVATGAGILGLGGYHAAHIAKSYFQPKEAKQLPPWGDVIGPDLDKLQVWYRRNPEEVLELAREYDEWVLSPPSRALVRDVQGRLRNVDPKVSEEAARQAIADYQAMWRESGGLTQLLQEKEWLEWEGPITGGFSLTAAEAPRIAAIASQLARGETVEAPEPGDMVQMQLKGQFKKNGIPAEWLPEVAALTDAVVRNQGGVVIEARAEEVAPRWPDYLDEVGDKLWRLDMPQAADQIYQRTEKARQAGTKATGVAVFVRYAEGSTQFVVEPDKKRFYFSRAGRDGQSQGMGSKSLPMLVRLAAAAQAHGYQAIDTHAVSDGLRVWPALGFRTTRELHGPDMKGMRFDLKPGSKSFRTLNELVQRVTRQGESARNEGFSLADGRRDFRARAALGRFEGVRNVVLTDWESRGRPAAEDPFLRESVNELREAFSSRTMGHFVTGVNEDSDAMIHGQPGPRVSFWQVLNTIPEADRQHVLQRPGVMAWLRYDAERQNIFALWSRERQALISEQQEEEADFMSLEDVVEYVAALPGFKGGNLSRRGLWNRENLINALNRAAGKDVELANALHAHGIETAAEAIDWRLFPGGMEETEQARQQIDDLLQEGEDTDGFSLAASIAQASRAGKLRGRLATGGFVTEGTLSVAVSRLVDEVVGNRPESLVLGPLSDKEVMARREAVLEPVIGEVVQNLGIRQEEAEALAFRVARSRGVLEEELPAALHQVAEVLHGKKRSVPLSEAGFSLALNLGESIRSVQAKHLVRLAKKSRPLSWDSRLIGEIDEAMEYLGGLARNLFGDSVPEGGIDYNAEPFPIHDPHYADALDLLGLNDAIDSYDDWDLSNPYPSEQEEPLRVAEESITEDPLFPGASEIVLVNGKRKRVTVIGFINEEEQIKYVLRVKDAPAKGEGDASFSLTSIEHVKFDVTNPILGGPIRGSFGRVLWLMPDGNLRPGKPGRSHDAEAEAIVDESGEPARGNREVFLESKGWVQGVQTSRGIHVRARWDQLTPIQRRNLTDWAIFHDKIIADDQGVIDLSNQAGFSLTSIEDANEARRLFGLSPIRISPDGMYAYEVERVPVAQILGAEALAPEDILLDISEALDVQIKYQGIGAAYLGVYYVGTPRTRIAYEGDLDTASHEIIHWLDQVYGVVASVNPPNVPIGKGPFDSELEDFWVFGSVTKNSNNQVKRFEGAAEWGRAWLLNPAAAEALAPKFWQHVQDNVPAETLAKLREFGDRIREYAGATGLKKIQSRILMDPSDTPDPLAKRMMNFFRSPDTANFKINWFDKFLRAWSDELRPLEVAWKFARQEHERLNTGYEVRPDNDAMLLARLFNGVAGQIEDIFMNGMHDVNRETVRGLEGGLLHLIEPLDSRSVKSLNREMHELVSYMVGQSILEMSRKLGRDVGLTGVDAGLGQSETEIALDALREVQSDPDKLARFNEAAKRFRAWGNATLRYARDKGMILPRQKRKKDGTPYGAWGYQEIVDNNLAWVPMMRVMESGPGQKVDNPAQFLSGYRGGLGSVKKLVHRKKGSRKRIENPYHSLMMNTANIVSEANKNEVKKAFTDVLRNATGMYSGDQINRLITIGQKVSEGVTNAIVVYNNGTKEHWQFHDDITRALKGWTDFSNLEGVWGKLVFALPSALRRGITIMPTFASKNLVRDVQHRLTVGRQSDLSMISHSFQAGMTADFSTLARRDLRAFRQSIRFHGNLDPTEMKRWGGDHAGFYGRTRVDYARVMNTAIDDAAQSGQVINPLRLVKQWEDLLQRTEQFNRIAEYRTAYDFARQKIGYDHYNASLYAAGQARGLMDFAVTGTAMKFFNKLVPFSNAAVQGLKRNLIAAREKPGAFFVRFLIYAALPTVAFRMLASLLGYEDDLDELPDYKRDMFWNVKLGPDFWLHIPRNFEIGVLAAVFERSWVHAKGLEEGLSHEKAREKAWGGYIGNLLNVLRPWDEEVLLGAYRPFIGMLANRDFFRKKFIVPTYEDAVRLDALNAQGEPIRRTERASRIGQAGQFLASSYGGQAFLTLVGFEEAERLADARKIDYLIKGIFGHAGDFTLRLSNVGRSDTNQKPGWRDLGFFGTTPAYASESVQQVYKLAGDWGISTQKKEFRTFHALGDAYYEATTRREREEAAKAWRAEAQRLIPWLEAEVERRRALRN